MKERIKSFKITTKRFPKQHIPRNFSVATQKPVAAVSATAASRVGGPVSKALITSRSHAFSPSKPPRSPPLSSRPATRADTRPRPRSTFPPRPGRAAQGPGRNLPPMRPSAPSPPRTLTARLALASPVLSFAEKPGELSLARLGLGGPSSKFSAIFTCSRKQPRARAARRGPDGGRAGGCEQASQRGASAGARAGPRRAQAGWGRRRPNLSLSNSAPQRSPPAPGRRRRRPRPPHPLPASRARHSAARAPQRPGRLRGPGWQRRRPAPRLRRRPGTWWCRRRRRLAAPPFPARPT